MTGEKFVDQLMYDTDRFQNLTTDTTYRTMALNWLNLAIKDLANEQVGYHWRDLEKTVEFPTVADQMSYDLPADIDTNKIYTVREKENDYKLNYIPQNDFDEAVPDSSVSSGIPRDYIVYAGVIRLYPVPDDAYTIYMRYIKIPTELADDDNSTDFSSKYDNVILNNALVRAFRFDKRLQEMAFAQFCQTKFCRTV